MQAIAGEEVTRNNAALRYAALQALPHEEPWPPMSR